MRQDLQIDASLIHLADAQRAEIIEPLNDIAARARARTELLDLRVLVMLFERDDVGLLCHSCSPSYASCRRRSSGQRPPARTAASRQSLFLLRRSAEGKRGHSCFSLLRRRTCSVLWLSHDVASDNDRNGRGCGPSVLVRLWRGGAESGHF